MSPEQWLTDYHQKLANAADSAAQTNARLRKVSGHAIAPHGEVEAWVNVSGALEHLRLTAHARALEPDKLADLIMATTKAAHQSVANQLTEIMTDFVGPGEALDMVKAHLPGEAPTTQASTHRPRKSTVNDDDYFANPEVRE